MSHFFYDTIIQRHLCRNINSCMSCLVFSFNTVFIQPNHQTLFELIWTGWHDHCQVPLWGRLEGRGVQREARWMRGCHRHCHHCHYHYQHCRHPWKWSQMITDFGAFFILTHLMIRCQTAVARVIALQVGNFDNCFSWRWSQCPWWWGRKND